MLLVTKARQTILADIEAIIPWDNKEAQDKAQTLAWVQSGAPLYRLQKPDVPPQHLVSYFALIHEPSHSILLLDHIKSGLWLPTGGHVEPGEDPRLAVDRECREELGIVAGYIQTHGQSPLFITINQTIGPGSHTDVSLWYVLAGDPGQSLTPDPREFRGHQWLTYDQVLAMPIESLDRNMHRFVRKLQSLSR